MKTKTIVSTVILLALTCLLTFKLSDNSLKAAAHLACPMPDSAKAWQDMTKGERKHYMKAVVLPKMSAEFAAFDPVKFKKMNCVTCHGDGFEEEKFDMPNPKIFKLPNSPDGFRKLMTSKDSSFMKFMSTKVKPEMAQLLGMPQFDPKTKKGFSCGACHTTEK